MENRKRSKGARKVENSRRRAKSNLSGMAYDPNSPFPPTMAQINLCGQILPNSVAAMFAQQSPPAELSFPFMMSVELMRYTNPIIAHTMLCFRIECCFDFYGDLNVGKASANKALMSLEKILLLNDHYQMIFDLGVWDIFNPPSLIDLKKLAARHPYQPLSALLQKHIQSCKEEIYQRMETILRFRFSNPQWEQGKRSTIAVSWVENRPSRYQHEGDKTSWRVENSYHVNVVAGIVHHEEDCRQYKITLSELAAFYINSEATFAKYYAKAATKPFLVPTHLKDKFIRSHFCSKFNAYCRGVTNVGVQCFRMNCVEVEQRANCKNADFAEKHLLRRDAESEYLLNFVEEQPEHETATTSPSEVEADDESYIFEDEVRNIEDCSMDDSMVESLTEMSFHSSVLSENQQWGHGGAVNSSQKVSSVPADDEDFNFEAEVRNAQKRSIDTSKVERRSGMSFHPSAPEEN